MEPIVLIGSGVVLFWFTRLLYIKVNYPYEGRHLAGTVEEVPASFHPGDSRAFTCDSVRYRELWIARMERRFEFLFTPIDLIAQDSYEQELIQKLSGWEWEKVPTGEWPKVWQKENA